MSTKVYVKINNRVQETCKNKYNVAILLFILLSLVCLLTMLIGSAIGSVYLNTFTFDKTIGVIFQRNNIKFTLFGYCINDICSNNTEKGK